MPIPIRADQYPTLIELINETYFDQVEQVTAAQVGDDDNILCVAIDGRKKLATKVTDTDISIKLMGGQQAANSLKFAAPKKKTCSKGISCRNTCINASKTCRVEISPNQKAKKAAITASTKQGSPESTKKTTEPKTESLVTPEQKALKAAGEIKKNNPDISESDFTAKANRILKIEKQDTQSDGDTAYKEALVAKEDIHGSEAALDRVDSLYRARAEQQKKGMLSDDRLRDIPSDFGQGMRGGSVQAANKAAAEYTAEIWGNLSSQQQDKFVEHWMDYARVGNGTVTDQLGKNTGFQETLKSKRVKDFVDEMDRRVRKLSGLE
jgi:hypothetical protein